MSQFKEMIKYVLENGHSKSDRTGTGTISVLGGQWRYDLKEYFPLFTEKRTWFRGVAEELLWFLDAYDGLDDFKIKNKYNENGMNIKYLIEKDVHIWDEWAYKRYQEAHLHNNTRPFLENQIDLNLEDYIKLIKKDDEFAENYGYLGPIYGYQWLNWDGSNQIENLIENLKTNPFDRGHILTAWNVADLENMALRPCHTFAQFYVREENNSKLLSCHLYQRSADLLLGVPFNVASYSLLTHMIANVVGYEVDELVHSFGDLHIYNNHIEGAKEILSRETLPYPTIKLKNKKDKLEDFRFEDFEILDYKHSGVLNLPVSV